MHHLVEAAAEGGRERHARLAQPAELGRREHPVVVLVEVVCKPDKLSGVAEGPEV